MLLKNWLYGAISTSAVVVMSRAKLPDGVTLTARLSFSASEVIFVSNCSMIFTMHNQKDILAVNSAYISASTCSPRQAISSKDLHFQLRIVASSQAPLVPWLVPPASLLSPHNESFMHLVETRNYGGKSHETLAKLLVSLSFCYYVIIVLGW